MIPGFPGHRGVEISITIIIIIFFLWAPGVSEFVTISVNVIVTSGIFGHFFGSLVLFIILLQY